MTRQFANRLSSATFLGELAEDARAQFEEHYFDCAICAADLKSGATFVEALRTEPQPTASPQRGIHVVAKRGPSTWLRPWLVPALAASLLVIAYQNVVVLPGMRRATAAIPEPGLDEQCGSGEHRRARQRRSKARRR